MITDPSITNALRTDHVIDITTTGRKSGKAARIETWFHRVGVRYFLTGTPGRRDWYANLVANPAFTFHLKRSTTADLAATATPVTEEPARREIMGSILASLDRTSELDAWVAESPLVEVTFAG